MKELTLHETIAVSAGKAPLAAFALLPFCFFVFSKEPYYRIMGITAIATELYVCWKNRVEPSLNEGFLPTVLKKRYIKEMAYT